MRALISVSDKKGIDGFCRRLAKLGYEIISTGGTAKELAKAGIKVKKVSDVTGFPEILDGRVKTLHPKIHGAILAKKEHGETLEEHGIKPIDIVVCNLYPFKETVNSGASHGDVIENIDIGGPTLIRAAAKNHARVLVVVDPSDYELVLNALENDVVTDDFREELARKAFHHTAMYDSWISSYFDQKEDVVFPANFTPTFKKVMDLRYGENPHQKAAFYTDSQIDEACVASAKQLHGKELSYNNILDANDALELVKDFEEPCAAVIKHTNPCGVAVKDTIKLAYKIAHETDPLSAFGSVVALNRPCTAGVAEIMQKLFIEVVIAPSFEEDALEILTKKKNIRLLETGRISKNDHGLELRKVAGGLLAQTRHFPGVNAEDLKIVSKRNPTASEVKDMLFAWKVCRHVKSNSIVFAKDNVTVGIGAGQMSRVVAAEIAAKKAGDRAKGAAMASDAFFPFRDGIDAAAKAGITAIIQPGGSIRDKEIIDAANEHGMAMALTGIRLFKH
ncbi:MAG: bifunctional phosphoribosylaminoimidazolecarboxamide formyltransferase/IMP cyclohydrolase [Nanoarchaeota archaeon]|nr:bifunctional phosphoribosylaminoimidazolecarboxamide formyltransferase/IMP cyclohydrolase [Nanoarchaeota archaeon]